MTVYCFPASQVDLIQAHATGFATSDMDRFNFRCLTFWLVCLLQVRLPVNGKIHQRLLRAGNHFISLSVGQCDHIVVSNNRWGSYSIKLNIPITETIDKWNMDITFSSPLLSIEVTTYFTWWAFVRMNRSTFQVWNAKWSTDGTTYHLTSHSNTPLTAGTVFNSVELIVFYTPSEKAPEIVSALFNGKDICNDLWHVTVQRPFHDSFNYFPWSRRIIIDF